MKKSVARGPKAACYNSAHRKFEMINVLASIVQRLFRQSSLQQRDGSGATQHSARESRTPSVAHARISDALDHDPVNGAATELHIVSELQTGEIPRLHAAINVYRKYVQNRAAIPAITQVFEFAAAHLYLQWLNSQTLETIRSVVSAISAIRLAAPESERIAAVYALALFEQGDLRSAEREFSALQTPRELPPLVEDLCVRAKRQLEEAKSINVSEPRGASILLLDTAFPSQISSFRYGEFSAYLRHFESSTCLSRPDLYLSRYGEKNSLVHQINAFVKVSGIQADRIRRFDSTEIVRPKIAYCVFLNIADIFVTQIGVPSAQHLIFTLYPGGGFAMHDQRSDTKLRKLCDNSRISKIITTQITTYNYLIEHGFCSSDRLQHIFGVVVPAADENSSSPSRTSNCGGPLNICFVAHRYSALGAEKGYDVFAGVVRALSNSPDFNFHVVGDFDRAVIDLKEAANVTFHGIKPAEFFPHFYAQMDAILSPNIQLSQLDASAPEYFDGFPTTCVVEAGLQGAAMFATDFLHMNRHLDGAPIFSDDEIAIIDRDVESIAETLQSYAKNRDALAKLQEAGKSALRREFSFDRQLRPRIELLNSYLNG